jgi:hypothetical protein
LAIFDNTGPTTKFEIILRFPAIAASMNRAAPTPFGMPLSSAT